MSKTLFKQPEKDQMILAISNGDGSYQMVAMTEQQATLINRASSMTPKEFFSLVEKMREAQKEYYFRCRSLSDSKNR